MNPSEMNTFIVLISKLRQKEAMNYVPHSSPDQSKTLQETVKGESVSAF
jgi:hypothetical protein